MRKDFFSTGEVINQPPEIEKTIGGRFSVDTVMGNQ
jgi:hypothetical protein